MFSKRELIVSPLPRDLEVDAFFSDEWLLPQLVSNPRGVHFSRFVTPALRPAAATLTLQNPLDPVVGRDLIQPESQIPVANQGDSNQYCIFIPPALFALAQLAAPAFPVKISVLF